jgi:hypothetical protein
VQLGGNRADAALLGLGEFRVLDAREVDGEVELVVETVADLGWCRACGVRAHSKGRPSVLVRDVDAFGRAGAAVVGQATVALPGAGV